MNAIIVCKQGQYDVQGYDFWNFHFFYKCPKCNSECKTNYCGNCGTKIEYTKKPKDFELHYMDGEWHLESDWDDEIER